MNTIFAMMMVAMVSISGFDTSAYIISADVTAVTEISVRFTDTNGNDFWWDLEEGDDYACGDVVSLTMNDNGTPNNVSDDGIVTIDKLLHLEESETDSGDWFLIDDGEIVM